MGKEKGRGQGGARKIKKGRDTIDTKIIFNRPHLFF